MSRMISVETGPFAAFAADLDGDGDVDAISGTGHGTIAWHELRDALGDACDNCDDCPQDFNPGQEDQDGDGIGDV